MRKVIQFREMMIERRQIVIALCEDGTLWFIPMIRIGETSFSPNYDDGWKPFPPIADSSCLRKTKG